MEIDSISNKKLRALYLEGTTKGLIEPVRLIKMLAFITAAGDFEELSTPPNYGLHPLAGNRAGEWSMTVTRNWRLTFRITDADTIADMDLEDYHGS